jgi:hypothetical protein
MLDISAPEFSHTGIAEANPEFSSGRTIGVQPLEFMLLY